MHRKRGPRREITDDLSGSIGRAIVTDYQLVWEAALGGYALELLYEKALTIVGNQSDR